MIYIKIHKDSGNFITAACDKELLGKIFREGKLVLNVSENFYKEKLVKEEDAEKYFKGAVNLNLVGKRSIDIALRLGIILRENIIFINGVPHAQAVVL